MGLFTRRQRAICYAKAATLYGTCLATATETLALGTIALGVLIIAGDIATIPSGEGAVGVALIVGATSAAQ